GVSDTGAARHAELHRPHSRRLRHVAEADGYVRSHTYRANAGRAIVGQPTEKTENLETQLLSGHNRIMTSGTRSDCGCPGKPAGTVEIGRGHYAHVCADCLAALH